MNEQTPPLSPADMIGEYIRLRDEMRAADKQYAQWLKDNFTVRMEGLENTMLDMLNSMNVDSIATPEGTAYKKMSTSVTIADAREFRRHVIGSEDWDLADWRANATAVNDRIEAGEPLPPGINRSTFVKAHFRRKT